MPGRQTARQSICAARQMKSSAGQPGQEAAACFHLHGAVDEGTVLAGAMTTTVTMLHGYQPRTYTMYLVAEVGREAAWMHRDKRAAGSEYMDLSSNSRGTPNSNIPASPETLPS
jgi:hypothetical protein